MGAEQAWLLAAIPAGVFFVLAIFGRALPRGGDYLGVAAIGTSFLLSFFVLGDLLSTEDKLGPITASIEWSTIGKFELRQGIWIDPITVTMFGVITTVALMVNVFSIGYMKGEPRYYWFFAVLQLFVASMLMLVMADNLLLVYISWELVGVCSFLLIGFYWEKRSATEAAKKAFITTRVGDVGLLIGIILLWKATGTFDIHGIIHAAEAGQIGQTYLFVSIMFVFLGCMGKSAQVPFHVWLPDAMEGPTPVSALIHAATMVVAGVYLTARLLPIFEVADGALLVVTIVGLTTALLTGFIALAQTDIKKVLAYSTVGQLGFMFVALGTGHPAIGMFHLATHAFFKALLFLGSGSVIHATHHNQEMEKLGGLWKKMPITGTTFFIGSLALAGVPPLAGFWSKDEIFVALNDKWGLWAVLILALAATMTAFYTTRLFIRTFMGKPMDKHVHDHTHESGYVMTGPLMFLAFLAVTAGFVVFHSVGKGLGLPGGITEFIFAEHHGPHEYEIDWGFAAASVVMATIGIFAAGWMYWGNSIERSTALAERNPGIYQMFKRKFYFDELYQAVIDRGVLGFSYVVSWFDRYVVNDTGVDGSAQVTGFSGGVLKYLQTGRVPNYAMAIALGVVGLTVAGLVVRG
ncbi:MAG: NADH-quinone oxidoreductase subunit L [Dehalococcoidia bacterium]|jgi:NADH-quinone oxidoreductase subunit L|uniref:NADH-quinone oxidoreductase subunit L n=1 Tax=Candidatus Amarobacter glycogenicus TaxID=3140699 RepID=UPI003135FA42|nr:NADH-quinone oxidoreductase subunit L [Dehalococcoidia bacterium]MBK7126452.1 NADH-quinone oxidoreductase subunit L [Dehalococcoidia bacterium]